MAFFAAGITASQYVIRHMAKARRLGNALDLLRFAIENISFDGLILEFGVFSGRTVNHIAGLVGAQKVYGFNSFEGLPEAWRPGFEKGTFKSPNLR